MRNNRTRAVASSHGAFRLAATTLLALVVALGLALTAPVQNADAATTAGAAKYTTTLDRQGGSSGTAKFTYKFGDASSLNPKKVVLPKRTGYSFKGYFTERNGAGVMRVTAAGAFANAPQDVSGNTTLYASWAEVRYTTTLDRQGGNGGDASFSYLYMDSKSLPSKVAIPTRSGYTFEGYYAKQNGGGTKYVSKTGAFSSGPQKVEGNTTLYAYWKPVSYTTTLDLQGGKGGTKKFTYKYDDASSLNPKKVTAPTRTGYTFEGFFAEKDGQGSKCVTATGEYALDPYKTIGNRTLYASWLEERYTATLDRQGGTGGDSSFTYLYKNSKALNPGTIAVPTKPGYTFGGYYTKQDGKGTKHVSNAGKYTGNPQNVKSNQTLYAYWTPNKYTTTLDRQGGSGGAAKFTYKYADASSLSPASVTVPKLKYQDFLGYYTQAGGKGEMRVNAQGKFVGNPQNVLGDSKLYARWSGELKYTATLNRDGGAGGAASIAYTLGNKNSLPASVSAPTKEGFTFAGYFTEKAGKGVQYVDAKGKIKNKLQDVKDNVTLYASWTKSGYDRIILDRNGGVSENSTSYFYHPKGKAAPMILPDGTKCSSVYDRNAKKLFRAYRKGFWYRGYWSAKLPDSTKYGFNAWIGDTLEYYTYNTETDINKPGNLPDGTVIYANWEKCSYGTAKVTLDRNGGTGGTGVFEFNREFNYSEKPDVLWNDGVFTPNAYIEPPTRAGYTFAGYFTADNKQVVYEDYRADKWYVGNVAPGCTKLVARWTKA